ncbi:DMT family transporter [Klenkia sp. LSe6-5]|uniref:DMT family transporter n=1 Tax=Klenkia sesuvii TaxID=3103137 RepID=A0ABU8DPJ3_9ACTN
MSRRGWALFVAMSVIWGVPYLLIKVAVGTFDPVLVVFARCVLGAVLLVPLVVARGQQRELARHWRPLLAFTVLEMTGPWLLLSVAEQTLSSSLTGLLVATVPFVAALAGQLLGGEEPLSRVRIVGMLVGVVGIGALLGLDVRGAEVLAIGAVVLTVVGYGTAPLIISRKLADVPGVAASAVALCVTSLVYAPFAVPRLDQFAGAPLDAVGAVVVLGLVCTAVALVLFFRLIREVGPQRALVITFVNPAVAVLLGVLLLGEPFTVGIAVGLPVILVGCVLATRRTRARAPEPLPVAPA